jgi:N-acetylmuramoyl-L-alanine amidase
MQLPFKTGILFFRLLFFNLQKLFMKWNLYFLLFLLFSCGQGKYAATNRIYKKQVHGYAKILSQFPLHDSTGLGQQFVGTTNFNMRKPNFVIIHHTAQNSCDQTLQTFTLKRTEVSAHYVICKDGKIYHMLNDYLRAWHGGVSKWGNSTDINSCSIGIELDNNGFESFTPDQLNSLEALLGKLKKAYGIPPANFIGHADIAPTRKNDPNKNFPWQRFAAKGFGLWYDNPEKIALPENFNYINALRIIGYDIKNESAAIRAFKLHFNNTGTDSLITETDRKIIYDLSKKY